MCSSDLAPEPAAAVPGGPDDVPAAEVPSAPGAVPSTQQDAAALPAKAPALGAAPAAAHEVHAPRPPAAAGGAAEPAGPSTAHGADAEAQSASELKLRRLIDSTSLDDVPRHPVRMDLSATELGRDLAPGQWLELISSTRKRILAKVAWINDRRSVVLLLQHPDRLILSRHVAALVDRAARRRAFRVG